MNNLNSKNNKGFTIIETLVAITILMISIAGPLSVAQKSLMASIYAKDQVTASFLAQEKMEEIKAKKFEEVKDENFRSWASGFGSSVDYKPLYIQPDGTYKEAVTTTKSKYSIYYGIKNNIGENLDEAKVTVKVKWDSGALVSEVTLENFIFNTLL